MVTYGSPDDNHKSFIHLDRILVLLRQRNGETEDPAELRVITWLKIQIVCSSAFDTFSIILMPL